MHVSSRGTEEEKRWGFTISDRRNTRTGFLEPRTILHHRYCIERVIGYGGMGAVYQARDLKRREVLCAVKEMSLLMVPPEEQGRAIQNFKTEAKMLWGLSHPNLPAFTNFFAENQRYFLVMEYIDGKTLEDLLERQGAPFPERRVIRWAEQLCDVLAYLHSQNPPIIFRDMKPGNIMLTRHGHIKLIDFGIARFFHPTKSPDTQLLGTPGYAPPEQYGTAQTDERSDIYSLGMTLFHLLSNAFSEKGFGVKAKDVRAINPQVSLSVAHALEKATALEPEMRYEHVAAFRLALCGASSFCFETGETATEPQELAELCARYPEEASEYLANGEIDSWLEDIGEAELARLTRRISAVYTDPLESVEQFLRIVVGPNARMHNDAIPPAIHESSMDNVPLPTNGHNVNNIPFATHEHRVSNRQGRNARATLLDWPMSHRESLPRLFTIHRRPSMQVSPRRLDFGSVYPSGISAPLGITISGYQGLRVRGAIHPLESWIRLDRTAFDGMNTYVHVRIQSTQLQSYTHYQGSVIILPDEEDQQDIVVSVHADIQGYSTLASGRRPGKTITPDEDEDEDEFIIPPSIASSQYQVLGESVLDLSAEGKRDEDLVMKYGQSGGDHHWEPCPATLVQQRYQQLGLAFCAAFMAGSLWYIWLSRLSSELLPPNAWFVIVLAGMIPSTTLGALLINRAKASRVRETINRIMTGMGCALAFLGPVHAIWQILLSIAPGWLQLAAMLVVTALGAVTGTTVHVHRHILASTQWLLKLLHYHLWPVVVVGCIPGGLFGYFLTAGVAAGVFTLLGILLGIGIVSALIVRVNYLLKRHGP